MSEVKFDEAAASEKSLLYFKSFAGKKLATSETQFFMIGARWQFTQDQAKLAELERENERLKQNLTELTESCEWYADKGTDQERHHFLAVEARANYLESL